MFSEVKVAEILKLMNTFLKPHGSMKGAVRHTYVQRVLTCYNDLSLRRKRKEYISVASSLYWLFHNRED